MILVLLDKIEVLACRLYKMVSTVQVGAPACVIPPAVPAPAVLPRAMPPSAITLRAVLPPAMPPPAVIPRAVTLRAVPPPAVILLVVILSVTCPGTTQAAHAQPSSSRSVFELVDGDRVVLLGSGFVEAAQEYGYIELALTTRWPDRSVSFRNVGWSGDTVFGDARLHYTNPPGPYERLLDEATASRPTVVFVGYGSNVPFEEGDALGRFEEGLIRLLGDLERETGASIVLLSPPPHEADMSPTSADDVRRINESLQQASDVIENVARERGHFFVDVFSRLRRHEIELDVPITRDGIHLNDAGYFYLAAVIEEGLGLESRGWSVRMDVGSRTITGEGRRVYAFDVNKNGLTFTLQPEFASVPPPEMLPPDAVPRFYARSLAVAGLRDGFYVLTSKDSSAAALASEDHDAVTSLDDRGDSLTSEVRGGSSVAWEKIIAHTQTWAQGIQLPQTSLDARSERLRRLVIEKNRLYFNRYRPPNETYLVGFRSYEQGQNADELERFDSLIVEKEREIDRLKTPSPLTLKLKYTADP